MNTRKYSRHAHIIGSQSTKPQLNNERNCSFQTVSLTVSCIQWLHS